MVAGEYEVQEFPVIMRHISCLPEPETIAQVGSYLQPEIIIAELPGHIALVEMLVHFDDGCNGTLDGSFRSKKINEGKRKQKDKAGQDT